MWNFSKHVVLHLLDVALRSRYSRPTHVSANVKRSGQRWSDVKALFNC